MCASNSPNKSENFATWFSGRMKDHCADVAALRYDSGTILVTNAVTSPFSSSTGGVFHHVKVVSESKSILQEQGAPYTTQTTLGQNGNTVAQQICLLHVMGRQNNDAASLVALHNLPNLASGQGIDAAGWFVQIDDLRPSNQGDGHRELSLLSSRQGRRELVGFLLQFQIAQQVSCRLTSLLRTNTFQCRCNQVNPISPPVKTTL